MTILLRIVLVALATAVLLSAQTSNNSQAAPQNGKQKVTLQGKDVGFVAVSPELQKAIEKKAGNKLETQSVSGRPDVFVNHHTFVRVSPEVMKGTEKAK